MIRILQITFWLTIFAGIMVILGFAVAEQKNVTCTGALIIIEDGENPGFIDEQDIRKIISNLYSPLDGRCLDSINTGAIVDALNSNHYLKHVRVYKSLNGQITVELSRTKSLVRVVNQQGHAFYLGTEGEVMPLSGKFIPKTMVATGYIPDLPNPAEKEKFNSLSPSKNPNSILLQIHFLAEKLNTHPVLKNSIEQIYVNQQGEIELVPASGDHIIALGNVDNLDHKLENLLAFYQTGLPKLTEGEYKLIDLKYKDQVVCKKAIQ